MDTSGDLDMFSSERDLVLSPIIEQVNTVIITFRWKLVVLMYVKLIFSAAVNSGSVFTNNY